jgi:hypothetical protein
MTLINFASDLSWIFYVVLGASPTIPCGKDFDSDV